MFIVFSNIYVYIYNTYTYKNNICIHCYTHFPFQHFAVFSPASQLLGASKVGPEVLLLTDDRACKAKAVNDGLVALRAAVAWVVDR